MDGDSTQVVLSKEVELEPGVKVECVSKFRYLGDTLGSGGDVVEAARARVLGPSLIIIIIIIILLD